MRKIKFRKIDIFGNPLGDVEITLGSSVGNTFANHVGEDRRETYLKEG